MWDWNPAEGESSQDNSSPSLLPHEGRPPEPPAASSQPILVPDVQGLRHQFQQQQAVLAHIKETLLENNADRTSKEKQLEMYTKKLAQIKSRSKSSKKFSDGSQTTPPSKASKENLASVSPAEIAEKFPAQAKMNELKKRLEENKLKFEERTEKGLTETKMLENMVEQIRTTVKERDVTIHALQKNMETTPSRPRLKLQTLAKRKRSKERPVILSKWTQTLNVESELMKRVKELEATVADLQDTVKQKDSIISARTHAVTLLSEDLSKKSKSTVDELEETRCQMKDMQANFVSLETHFKSELLEKNNRIISLEESTRALETANEALINERNEINQRLEKEGQSHGNVPVNTIVSGLEMKVAQLEKELEDSNKMMIRLKLEQKQKLKAAKEMKRSTNDNSETADLLAKVEELKKDKTLLSERLTEMEEEKGNLLLSLLDFDDLKASHEMKSEEAREIIDAQEKAIQNLKHIIESQEKAKGELNQSIEEQNMLIEMMKARSAVGVVDAGQPEGFDIPGDGASHLFSLSNSNVQGQINELVYEKQQLIEKLRGLHSMDSTFEHVPASSHVMSYALPVNDPTTSDPPHVMESTSGDGATSSTEESIAMNSKEIDQLKNKLNLSLIELKKEKAVITEMNDELLAKDLLIAEMTRKLQDLEQRRKDSVDSLGEPDVGEIQQKYLTVEQELLQLSQKYEHLRKENIELTGEKVRRMEGEEAARTVRGLQASADELETRIAALEALLPAEHPQLQYANIVIASNDTEIFNLQSSLANRAQEIDALNEKLKEIENENHHLKLELGRQANMQESRVADFTAITAKAEQDQKKFTDYLQEKEAEYNRLKTEYNSLIEELESRSRTLKALKSELESSKHVLEKVKGDMKVQKEESMQQLERIRVIGAENNRLNEEIIILRSSVLSLTQQLEQERSMAVDRETNLQKQLEEATLKCDETEKVLQKTWSERNDLIQSREGLLQRLRQSDSEMEAVRNEREEAMKQFHALSNQIAASSLQVQQLQDSKTDSDNQCKDAIAKHEAMTVKAKKLAANLKKKTQTEKELLDQVNTLKLENGELMKRLVEVQERVDTSSSESSDLERILSEKEKILNESRALEEQNRLLISQVETISKQLELVREEKQSLILKIQSLETEIKQQATAIDLTNKVKMELEATLRDADIQFNKQVEDFEAENKSNQQKLVEVNEKWLLEKQEKEELQSKFDERYKCLQQAFEMEQQENETLTCQRASYLQEKEQDLQKLREMQAHTEQIETELQLVYKKINELQDSVSREQSDKNLLIGELKERDARISDLLSSLASMESASKKFKDESIAVSSSLHEAKLQNQQLASEIDQIKAEADQFKARVDQLSNDKLGLTNTLNEKSLRNSNLESSMSSLQSEFVAIKEEMSSAIASYQSQIALLQKQISNFDVAFDAEVQKNLALKAEIDSLKDASRKMHEDTELTPKDRSQEEKSVKRKKSVTFSEEADYIKELREEVGSLHRALQESDATVGELKAALQKEENETISKSFNVNLFDRPKGNDFLTEQHETSHPFSMDSLQWDDSWGAEGQLEADHIMVTKSDPEKVSKLETEVKAVYAEKEMIQEELRVLQVKYSKVVKKFKEQKLAIEQLQSELKSKKLAVSDMGGLDDALFDEIRNELKKAEAREEGVRKDLEALSKEKEVLLKHVENLTALSDVTSDAKLKQDSEAHLWQTRNAELRAQLVQLEAQLVVVQDDNQLASENRELKNLIEGLEWKVCELTEMVEEKEETLTRLTDAASAASKTANEQDADGMKSWKEMVQSSENALRETQEKLRDTESQLAMLVAENDALQSILNDQKVASQTESSSAANTKSLADWFPSDDSKEFNIGSISPRNSESDGVPSSEEIKQLKNELNLKNQQIEKLANDLSEAQMEKCKLLDLLEAKEREVAIVRGKLEDLNTAYAESKLEIERLLSEEQISSDAPLEELQAREREIIQLQDTVQELQKAYDESKIEIGRLLMEDRLGSDATREEELSKVQGLVEMEKARYESVIKAKDSEIESLRQSLISYESDYDAAQGQNAGAVHELKAQMRELESISAQTAEEKELELREITAECAELRGLLAASQNELSRIKAEFQTLESEISSRQKQLYDEEIKASQSASEERYQHLSDEYNRTIQYLNEKAEELKKIQPSLDQKDAELLSIRQELKVTQQRMLMRESEATQVHASLEADLLARDAEVRELRADRLQLESELRELRTSIKQLEDRSSTLIVPPTHTIPPGTAPNDSRPADADEFLASLRSDLDSALYMLHLRDVRCDELTFELMQLLEERDTLQLRLSTMIRQNEELRLQSNESTSTAMSSHNDSNINQGQLANKISELHNVGYGRDKNLQDESQQRHKDQMALITRQVNSSVMDV